MMEWLEICLLVNPELAEAVAEVLSRYVPHGVAIDLGDGDATEVAVKAYLPISEDTDAIRRQIEEALWHLGQICPLPDPQFTRVPDQDWTAAWKSQIQVLHLGRRLVIKPSWREYTPGPGEVMLEMDPGLAFGTGLHPTTQMCVELLEELLQPGMRVLDMGTGTGILALAAAKLGAAEVVAVDNDFNAIVAARRNAEVNAIGGEFHLLHGSLPDVHATYDLVLGNLLAPIIIHMAETGLVERAIPGGVLVLSGVLDEQADAVAAALEGAGAPVYARRQQGDWVALLARRNT